MPDGLTPPERPDELVTGPTDRPVLRGSCCTRCATVSFPVQASCPRCTSTEVEACELATRGTLWTWTIQGFPPKAPYPVAPDDFEPYGVGYVELAGQVRVEARLTVADPQRLRIGMPMVLTTVPRPGGADGETIYAFAPEEATA